ncbi:MAG: hypothetical protein WDO24_12130 [Pseudomonadota bacterium]
MLSQLPALTKDVIGADAQVVTLFLTAFSIGIGVGSMLCNRLLRGEVSLRLVPWGALGLSLFTIDLFFACRELAPPAGGLMDLDAFLAVPANWRVLADLLLSAVAAGIYTVPLYAILQVRSLEAERSRVIATGNILAALFMVVGALATVALLAAGLSVTGVILGLGLANLGVVGAAWRRK